MSLRFLITAILAVVVAAGAGWVAGASGRSVVEQQRARAEMRAEFADARASILDGQINVIHDNSGNAVQAFQNARNRIAEIQRQLREIGQPEQAGRLEVAVSHLSDAQHLSAAFDPRAEGAAEDALKALMTAGGG